MLKPPMSNLPGATVVTDTLDFVKNLWGSMSVPGVSLPGMSVPTLSVDELDKKIADLKAVEAWLNVNMTMLRGSIQALEVQRGTIATLKSMGASLAAAVQQPGANEKSVLEAVPFASAFFAAPPAPAPAATAEPVDTAEPAAPAAPLSNPGAWWNLLQDQFKQAVSTAMTSDALSNASAMAQEAAAKFSAPRGASDLLKTAAKAAPKASASAKAAPPAAPAAKRAPAKARVSKPKTAT